MRMNPDARGDCRGRKRDWRSQKCFVSPKPGRAVYGVKWLRMYLAGRIRSLLYALYADGALRSLAEQLRWADAIPLNRGGLFMAPAGRKGW